MPNQLEISDEAAAVVADLMHRGRYSGPAGVVEDALKLLDSVSAVTDLSVDEDMLAEVRVGIDELDRGLGETFDVAVHRARLQEARRGREEA